MSWNASRSPETSSTSNPALSPMVARVGVTGASVAGTGPPAGGVAAFAAGVRVEDEGCTAASSSRAGDGKGAGLVVSLTGASLVAMTDNFTPGAFAGELAAAGIPDH